MSAVSSVLPVLTQQAGKVKNLKKAGSGALLGGAFCALDFLTVPGAFKLKYNTEGEKVEGTNWKSGLKELGKSAVKCASYLAVPAMILGMASGAGPLMATVAGVASFASSFVLSSLFEETLPEEKKLVAEACEKKGISLNQIV